MLEIVPNWFEEAYMLKLIVNRSKDNHFVLKMTYGGCFYKKMSNHFFLLRLNFSCFYCSIDVKR